MNPEGEKRYSSTLSLSSELGGVGGQRHAPAALLTGKSKCPLYRRLGGPHGRSGRVRNISPPQGFDCRTVQPVASRYTDSAIPAHTLLMAKFKYSSSSRIVFLHKCETKCIAENSGHSLRRNKNLCIFNFF